MEGYWRVPLLGASPGWNVGLDKETGNISVVVTEASPHPQGEDLGCSCRIVLYFIFASANHWVHSTLGGYLALREEVPCS